MNGTSAIREDLTNPVIMIRFRVIRVLLTFNSPDME